MSAHPAAGGSRAPGNPDLDVLRGRDIVCIGLADWRTELLTSQHHLMARLAETNRILFVESLGLRRPQISGRDIRRVVQRARGSARGVRHAGDLLVLSPITAPFHGYESTRRFNAALLRRQVGAAVDRVGMRNPILWGYSPHANTLVEALDPSLVIYHCVDDLAAHKGVDPRSFRDAEKAFAARADLVLASAPALAVRMHEISGSVLYAPNVADVPFFATAQEPGEEDAAIARLPGPRVVFTGAVVSTKLDMEFLVHLARSRPHWSFALVGPIGFGDPATDVSVLRAEPNIHLLGPRHYRDLPKVLRAADAALIPYALNALTLSVFPMKVYEYLAAGLPVVSTRLPSLEGVEGLTLVSDARHAARELDRLMALDRPALRHAQWAAAQGHSWDERLVEIALATRAVSGDRGPRWSTGDLVVDLQNA